MFSFLKISWVKTDVLAFIIRKVWHKFTLEFFSLPLTFPLWITCHYYKITNGLMESLARWLSVFFYKLNDCGFEYRYCHLNQEYTIAEKTLVSTKFANQATLLHVVLKSYFYKYKKFSTVEPGKQLDVGINRLSNAKWGCVDIKFTLCNISNQSFLRNAFSGDLSTLKIKVFTFHTSMVPPPRSQCTCVWQKPKSKSFWFLKLGFHDGITWYNVV